MRAALLTRPGTIEICGVQDPVPEDGEVLIRMRSVGLCGSDLSVYTGARAVPQMPWIMGHEGGGEIVAVGAGIDPERVGELVVIEPNLPCLKCSVCTAGVTSVCPHRDILGINAPGLLAELVALPGRFAHRLTGPAATDEAMAILEPLAVARAASSLVTIPQGADVLVAGAGSQGLLMVQLLVAQGAKPWVMEIDGGRVAHARALGAENATDESAPQTFSYVVDAVGSPGLWRALLPKLAAPVSITVIGMSEEPWPLTTKQITRGRMSVNGSIIYDHPRDFLATIDAVASGVIDPKSVLNSAGRFSNTDEVFAAASTAPGKSWVVFD